MYYLFNMMYVNSVKYRFKTLNYVICFFSSQLTCVAWLLQTAPGSCQSTAHCSAQERPSGSSEASPSQSPLRNAAQPHHEQNGSKSMAG